MAELLPYVTLHLFIYKFIYNTGLFLVYNFMSFDKFIRLCNHSQDIEKFQYPFQKTSLMLLFCSQTPLPTELTGYWAAILPIILYFSDHDINEIIYSLLSLVSFI